VGLHIGRKLHMLERSRNVGRPAVLGWFWILEWVHHGGNLMRHGDIHILVGVVLLDG
jgi:hypothetical protein